MEEHRTDEEATNPSASGRWITTRAAAMRVWFRQWRRESWVAAIITTGGILVVVLNAVVGVLDKKTQAIKFLGWNKCYVFDPKTEEPNTKLERPCLPGKITFVTWKYPFAEPEN